MNNPKAKKKKKEIPGLWLSPFGVHLTETERLGAGLTLYE